MEKKAARLRVISSVLMALVLGFVSACIGLYGFLSFANGSHANLLEAFAAICFLAGPIMMWITHRFYHQTKVIYIILLTIGLPLVLIGATIGIWSFDAVQSARSADIPGEQMEGHILGTVMMYMFTVFGVVVAIIGSVLSTSAFLGLRAFKIRARIPPELASHSISRQSHRSKVWPLPR